MSTLLRTQLQNNRIARLTEAKRIADPIPTPKSDQRKPYRIAGPELADQIGCWLMLLDVAKRLPENRAKPIIQATLDAIVITWWQVEARNPKANPSPENCPLKLFNRKCLRREDLRALHAAYKPDATGALLLQVAGDSIKTLELQFHDLLSGGREQ